MAIDPEILKHKEWLGFLQPVGLVVSPVALVKGQAIVNRNVVELQQRLQAIVSEEAQVTDFATLAIEVLEWQPEDLVSGEALQSLEVLLRDYDELLAPSYAVLNADGDGHLMLIKTIAPGLDLDQVDDTEKANYWRESPQAKFERLLRETGVAIGLLCNGTQIRLVYAPRGESSGYLTFPVQAMLEVSGRLILGAMEMLLGSYRVFLAPTGRQLINLLEESRKYQAEVSTTLANQVLDALWELLRGFQMADAAISGKLLSELAAMEPQHIYGGLITTLMRLVFLLYAEDEGLMPPDEVYQRNYAVSGLYDRLREDAGNYPDTMDQRYGAWAWLLSLFRLVYDGGGQTPKYLPARHGQLFNPDEYSFLEGRSRLSRYEVGQVISPPRVPDGVVYRVLEKLLILDGERLSYRSLDVEQIGSVYESIMGFAVERAEGPAVGVYSKPKGSKVSTTVVIDAAALLMAKANDRAKLLKEWANCEIMGNGLKTLKEATTLEEMVAAIGRRISKQTPTMLPVGSLYLQPGEERRRSGSHYTPRSLTKPIVETTLRPVLGALGECATAEQILSLKVCDLAMGSGAFLVEACRQLAEKVVEAWDRDGLPQELPEGDEPLLYARRLVAQRCLYGVDKNPFAVNLAKLSLWLVTLSKDLPFTFLDHALKCGDSLVGLKKAQIGAFGKDPIATLPLMHLLEQQVDRARSFRSEIQAIDTRSDADDDQKRSSLAEADRALKEARLTGDVAVAAFFEGSSKKERQERTEDYGALIRHWRVNGSENSGNNATDYGVSSISWKLRNERAIAPFNWEIEFPEVFDRANSGFDAIVGNPPFAGKNTTINGNAEGYLDWLKEEYPESHGNSDLVAYFFRRSFDLLRQNGTLGLIATNTIAQGDTRSTGLRWLCKHNGTIYNTQKRVKWAGAAAVVVSVINILKGIHIQIKTLNEKEVSMISAFLFHAGGNENPGALLANVNKSFVGSYVLGMGFTFDDTNENSTSIAEMNQLIEKDPRNAERIFPYIGGEEVNSSPTHSHHRYVINFFDMSEEESWQYPDLMQIVKDKVKPERDVQKRDALRVRWWQYAEKRPGLVRAIADLDRVLVCCIVSKYISFAFLPSSMVYSHKLCVFALDSYSAFAILQGRIHECFAWFFSSTMKDDLNYSPSDCFETFPFPENWETDRTLEEIGKHYYEYRADLMIRNSQGLTDTYNRFHDPDEHHPDILKLRSLHADLDRAVLVAYGWQDLSIDCQFLLDYEDDETDETPNKRKKPWRYRWSEATHDEVLARLLDLNQQRHQQEILGGKHAEKKGKKQKAKAPKPSTAANALNPAKPFDTKQLPLIPPDQEQLDVWSTIEPGES